MQNTSANYKAEIKKASRSFECRVTIGDNVYTNIDIVDIILDTPQPQDGFNIGCTTSQTLDLTLLNKEATIYSINQIKLEIGLLIGSKIEYILMGYYNIDEVVKSDYTTKFTCYDNIIKFEIPYFSNLGETSTLQQVVNELVSMTGVQFTGSLPSYSVSKLEGFTCREILSYVSGVCGGNASITRDGKFTILYPVDSGITFSADNYIDYKREEVKYKIGKVSCQVGDKEINRGSLGTDSMELQFENPWVTESILNDIYNRVKTIEYLGYSMKWQGDMSLDVGDIVTVTDYKNVVRKIPILSQKFTYTGGLTSEIGAKGQSKNKNSFSSSGSNTNKVNRVVTDLLIANEALINKANIQDLESVSIRTQTLEAKVTITESLLAGNITGGNIQTGGLTGDNLNMNTVFIRDANIIDMSAGKITSGEINTNQVTITSEDGGMKIIGATQQFLDKNNRIRIQLGQDAQGEFDFYILSEAGEILFNTRGITGNAIEQGLIKEEMIGDGAVGGKKINWTSFSTEFNKDTNTNTLKSSKILLDGTSQTLDIHFNKLESKVEENIETTISNTTQLNIADGKINTLIQDTTIIKDGETIKLVDDYNRTTQTVSSMNSIIGNHTSQINEATGQITSVNTRISNVERDLNGLSSKVSATETNLNNNYSTTSAMNSAINQSASSIRGEVSSTYVTNNTANNIFATKASMELTSNQLRLDFSSSGGYNYLKNGQFLNGLYAYGEHQYGWQGNGTSIHWVDPNSEWCLPGRNTLQIRGQWNNSQGHYGVYQHTLLKANTQYTISGYFASHRCQGKVYAQRNNTWECPWELTLDTHIGGKDDTGWAKFQYTFTTPVDKGGEWLIHFKMGYAEADAYAWYTDLTLAEGGERRKYAPHPSEIYAGNTTIDAGGVTINNGALRVNNKRGQAVILADSNGDLDQKGVFSNLNSNGTNGIRLTNLGAELVVTGEVVGGMRTSSLKNNESMNGVVLASTLHGDYMDISHISQPNFGGVYTFTPQMRFVPRDNSTMGKKGIHVLDILRMKSRMYCDNQAIMTSATYNDSIYSTNAGIFIGSENSLNLGFVKKTGDVTIETNLRLQELYGTKRLTSWVWFDMQGYEIYNTTLTKSYSTVNKKTGKNVYNTTSHMEGHKKQIRIPLEAYIKGGKCRINIPLEYLAEMGKYIVVGLTKCGRGDLWLAEELEDHFIIEADNDIKFSLDIVIFKNDVAERRRKTVTPIDQSEEPVAEGYETFGKDKNLQDLDITKEYWRLYGKDLIQNKVI